MASFQSRETNNKNVEVRVIDQKKNRSLIATKAFSKGEPILSEEPLVCSQFTWNQFYNYKACEYCMSPLETAEENVKRLAENNSLSLPYLQECCLTRKELHCKCECGIEYCSEICRQSAFQKYHKSLCLGVNSKNQEHPLNILIEIWRQIHLPPETTTINLILKMIAMIKQASDKSALMQRFSNFDFGLVNEQEQLPHKLLGEKFYAELEGLRQLTLEVFNTQLYVKECEPWLTSEGFRQVFSLIGRNSQGVGTSPFSVWVEKSAELSSLKKEDKKKLDKLIDKIYVSLDKACGSFLNSEGSALYELQSMANHSCKPNAEIQFKDNSNFLTLVALEEIKANEEIVISYLDECELSRSRHSRQKALRDNYLFTCQCERCLSEADQKDETSDEEIETDDEDEEEEADSADESMDN